MGRYPTIWDMDPEQNAGPDLAVGVPGPESDFLTDCILVLEKCPNADLGQVFEFMLQP